MARTTRTSEPNVLPWLASNRGLKDHINVKILTWSIVNGMELRYMVYSIQYLHIRILQTMVAGISFVTVLPSICGVRIYLCHLRLSLKREGSHDGVIGVPMSVPVLVNIIVIILTVLLLE